MDTLYTFWDNSTHYKTESVNFLGLMNSATKVTLQLIRIRCLGGGGVGGFCLSTLTDARVLQTFEDLLNVVSEFLLHHFSSGASSPVTRVCVLWNFPAVPTCAHKLPP